MLVREADADGEGAQVGNGRVTRFVEADDKVQQQAREHVVHGKHLGLHRVQPNERREGVQAPAQHADPVCADVDGGLLALGRGFLRRARGVLAAEKAAALSPRAPLVQQHPALQAEHHEHARQRVAHGRHEADAKGRFAIGEEPEEEMPQEGERRVSGRVRNAELACAAQELSVVPACTGARAAPRGQDAAMRSATRCVAQGRGARGAGCGARGGGAAAPWEPRRAPDTEGCIVAAYSERMTTNRADASSAV